MRNIFLLLITLCFFELRAQDSLQLPPAEHVLQNEYESGYLFNINGSYNHFGNFRHSSVGLKLGALTEYKWAFGLHFNFIQLGIDDNNHVWQLKGGPFVRYYFMEENFRFFLGAQASYASFNETYNKNNFGLYEKFIYESFQFGPQAGLNIPLSDKFFLELLVEHVWSANAPGRDWIDDNGDGKFNYELGFVLIL